MSVNKCIFLGHVGKDPEVKTVGDNKVATFSLAMIDPERLSEMIGEFDFLLNQKQPTKP